MISPTGTSAYNRGMVKIAVLASFNMDLVMRAARRPTVGETLQAEFGMFLGGKGFNQAIAARRLGADVAVIGRVGDDEFGRAFIATLDREGIERGGVAVDAHAGTGVASIVVEPDGANSILQAPRANRNVSAADIARSVGMIERADVSMLQLETSMEAAIAFAAASRNAAVRTLLNPAPAGDVPQALLALADVLVPNEIEVASLAGTALDTLDDAFAAAVALNAKTGSVSVITLGDRGALAVHGTDRFHVGRAAVVAVDTVGAGDAFCAALAVRLGEGADLLTAITFANAAGALACTRAGAEPSMPRRTDVDALAAAPL